MATETLTIDAAYAALLAAEEAYRARARQAPILPAEELALTERQCAAFAALSAAQDAHAARQTR